MTWMNKTNTGIFDMKCTEGNIVIFVKISVKNTIFPRRLSGVQRQSPAKWAAQTESMSLKQHFQHLILPMIAYLSHNEPSKIRIHAQCFSRRNNLYKLIPKWQLAWHFEVYIIMVGVRFLLETRQLNCKVVLYNSNLQINTYSFMQSTVMHRVSVCAE